MSDELAEARAEVYRLRALFRQDFEDHARVFKDLTALHELRLSKYAERIEGLFAQVNALTAQNAAMRAALRGYEKWEALLIMDNKAWRNGLPLFTQELWDEFMGLQAKRNAALAQTSGGKQKP